MFNKLLKVLRIKHNKQQGFTLIELMVALAVSSIILSGITVTIYQIVSINALASNRMYAVNQVQNAGYWISNDAEMAHAIDVNDDIGTPDLELVTIDWVDWDGNTHKSVYTLAGGIIKRSYILNLGTPVETIIAQNINPSTSCVLDETYYKRLIVTLSATVGGFKPVTVNRIYETIPRPSV